MDRARRTRPRSASPTTGASSSPRSAAACSSTTRSPTRRRRSSPTSRRRSTTSGTAACSAWRSIPTSPRAARTSTCSTPTTRTRPARTVPRWGDNCPTPPGATADGCVVSGRLSRLGPGGVETPLITDWCQQFPSHSVGDLVFGPAARSTCRPATARPSTSPTTARTATRSTRAATRAARRRRRRPPRAARCAARTCARPATRPAPTARSCASNPDTGAALPDNPAAGAPTRDAPDRRARLPQPVPPHAPPGHRRGLGRRRRLERVGGDQPPRRADRGVTQLRLALLRGRRARCRPTTTSTSTSASRSTRRVPRPTPRRTTPTGTPTGDRRRGLPVRHVVDRGARVLHGHAPSRPATATALFFADYSRSCIWFMPRGANGLPDPAQRESFSSGAGRHRQPRPGARTASLYYPDLNNGAVRRISYGAPNDGADGAGDRDAGERRRPAGRAVRRDRARRDPNGDTLAYAWDLDGDGAYDDATGARPTLHLREPGVVAVAAARDRHGRPAGHRRRSRSPRAPRRSRRSTTPDRRHDLGGRRHDRLHRRRDATGAGRGAARVRR